MNPGFWGDQQPGDEARRVQKGASRLRSHGRRQERSDRHVGRRGFRLVWHVGDHYRGGLHASLSGDTHDNQPGPRASAEMVGIVSVAEEWSVARHREWAEEKIVSLPAQVPFVLDAGTGLYLNALVLGVPLAPKVSPRTRAEAERLVIASGAENTRRAARKLELEIVGAQRRGSIWEGTLRYDAAFVYLRPERAELDQNIRARSSGIVREGVDEAERLLGSGIEPNPSVRGAIGVKEMLLHVSGDLSARETEDRICARTRRLARRQIRWFDKLERSLPDNAPLLVVEDSQDEKLMHFMHDRMSP